MGNVRYNISPCTVEEANGFVNGIDNSKYIPRSTVKADGNSFYDRYMYTRDENRVAVVYDNRGKVISISAPKEYADELLAQFSPNGKQVKKSNLPSHGNGYKTESAYDLNGSPEKSGTIAENKSVGTRARVFVSPSEANKIQNREYKKREIVDEPVRGAIFSTDEIYPPQRAVKKTAVILTANGDEMSTDEIFPPQRVYRNNRAVKQESGDSEHMVASSPASVQYKRTYSYGTGFIETPYTPKSADLNMTESAKPIATGGVAKVGSIINAKSSKRSSGARQAVISFGDDDDLIPNRTNKPRSGTGVFADISGAGINRFQANEPEPITKPRRGRPPKPRPPIDTNAADIVAPVRVSESSNGGYSIKNYPPEALNAVLKRLRSVSKYKVATEGNEFSGTAQEVKTYSVTDALGQKVYLRYATNKQTLSLQGKRSDLFGEIQTQVSRDSDYSSALEGYVESSDVGKGKVGDVEKLLLERLPTATHFLSEQSKIDFSYGLHDFAQTKLRLSDYSVLLVPPYRGLERFVFDLQRAEGIKVKMIGQAFDKDENGNYILKTAYQRRIGSVVYSEVMVSLYTEYFSRRNFFAHSDNTDGNVSRSITDKTVAKRIFDNLLRVVEYNARKLKEIGFSMAPSDLTFDGN